MESTTKWVIGFAVDKFVDAYDDGWLENAVSIPESIVECAPFETVAVGPVLLTVDEFDEDDDDDVVVVVANNVGTND